MPQTTATDRAGHYRALGAWRDGTFVDDLKRWARQAPDRPAIVTHFWKTGTGPDVTLTYAEYLHRVDRVAAGLVELGVQPGDRVFMQLGNQWQASVLVLACARIGAVIAPCHVATLPAEVAAILADSGAAVAVSLARFGEADTAAAIAALRPDNPGLRHQIVVGGPVPAGALDFGSDLLGTAWEDKHPDLDARAPGPDDRCQIIYTSGTTGRPKGVVHSYNTLHAMARGYTGPMGVGPDDVLCTPGAVGGQAGFLYGLLCPLIAGATAVWTDSWDTGHFLDTMARYGVTVSYFMPPVLSMLLDEQRARPRPLRLRRMVAGSAPIPPGMPAEVRDVLGVPLHPLWGMSENGGVTIGRPDDPADWAAGSDGRPVDWMWLRLVDDDGNPVPDGEPGRLLVRGANQCLGYHGNAAGYAAALSGDGWFDTGDVARPDGRGGIKIVGRTKDMINRGGLHIPTVQVEKVLLTHPRVRDVALVGQPDPALGELAVAFVVPDGEPPALDDLRAQVEDAGLNPGFAPDRLETLAELPRNAAGKVLKRELRRLVDGG